MSAFSVNKNYLPHLLAIISFSIITLMYFSPVLDNQILQTNDTSVFKGSVKEIVDHRQEYHEEPLWTNAIFGGMPAYLISTNYPGNILKPFYNILRAPGIPVAPILLLMIGFYILLLSFRVNPWLAIAGSIAYGFSSYFFIILAAGHNTKAMALAFMAPLIGSIIYAYKRDRITGSVLTSLFLTLQLIANHYQVTYYAFMCVLVFGIIELYNSIKDKTLPKLITTTAMLIGAVIIALSINFASIYVTLEYGKYSMRSKSELSSQDDDKTGGLDRSYATHWSYGIDETLSLLIPNIKGGATQPFDRDSQTVRVLRQNNAAQNISQIHQYWGNQPNTSGPVYVGAIIVLLFIMGLVLIKGPYKWWLLSATILSIMLAWGKNFMFLTDLFLDYFPGYNKFRAVTMILVIAQFCMPLLAILTLDKIFKQNVKKQELIKAFKIGLGITGGILLLFLMIPGLSGSFISANELQYPGWLKSALITDRKEMLRTDAFRSLVFVVLASIIIFLAYSKKIKTGYAIGLLAFILLIDLWPVNKRYLNNDYFKKDTEAQKEFNPTLADNFILEDTSVFRVLNLTVSPFNDGKTSYLHHSIGGYHGAKVQRYQDLIESSIIRDISLFSNSVRNIVSASQLDSIFLPLNSLNMLNAKYIIINPNGDPLTNTRALGNAWFVKSFRMVNTPDEELAAINNINPAIEAVIDNRFSEILDNTNIQSDSLSSILLSSYKANEMIYDYSSQSDQLAIFSEIYYPKGWNAYIDGQAVKHFRANYVLRAMVLPAGEHQIIFKFEPESYKTGNKVSLAGSIILILLLLASVFYWINKHKSQENADS